MLTWLEMMLRHMNENDVNAPANIVGKLEVMLFVRLPFRQNGIRPRAMCVARGEMVFGTGVNVMAGQLRKARYVALLPSTCFECKTRRNNATFWQMILEDETEK